MGFTYIGGAEAYASGVTTLALSPALSVQVGDLLVGFLSREGANTFSPSMYKSGSPTTHVLTFDESTYLYENTLSGALGYRVVTEGESSVTFLADWGASSTWVHTFLMQFRPTSGSTVTKDDYAAVGGPGASANSGAFDSTGTDAVAVGVAVGYKPATPSSEAINGTAADGRIVNGGDAASSMFYRILSSPFTGGAATATVPNDVWIAFGISFKATATAADPPIFTLDHEGTKPWSSVWRTGRV